MAETQGFSPRSKVKKLLYSDYGLVRCYEASLRPPASGEDRHPPPFLVLFVVARFPKLKVRAQLRSLGSVRLYE
jgi:hypothetical protein